MRSKYITQLMFRHRNSCVISESLKDSVACPWFGNDLNVSKTLVCNLIYYVIMNKYLSFRQSNAISKLGLSSYGNISAVVKLFLQF